MTAMESVANPFLTLTDLFLPTTRQYAKPMEKCFAIYLTKINRVGAIIVFLFVKFVNSKNKLQNYEESMVKHFT